MNYKLCNHRLVEENGFVYCEKCGLEISRVFDPRREKGDWDLVK